MNELALCVINTGRHYNNRVRVARFSGKAQRLEYWRTLAADEAVEQIVNFGRAAATCEEINEAALDIEDYMRRHIAEWTACEANDPSAIANLPKNEDESC